MNPPDRKYFLLADQPKCFRIRSGILENEANPYVKTRITKNPEDEGIRTKDGPVSVPNNRGAQVRNLAADESSSEPAIVGGLLGLMP